MNLSGNNITADYLKPLLLLNYLFFLSGVNEIVDMISLSQRWKVNILRKMLILQTFFFNEYSLLSDILTDWSSNAHL